MLLRRLALFAVLALSVPSVTRAADLDPYLPADTESYVCVNVKQVLDSPLFKKYVLDSAKEALKESEINGLLQELGFDPFKHLDRVVIASPQATDTDRGLFILTGTFDLEKIKKKADDAARASKDNFKLHKVPLGGGMSHDVYEVVVPGQDLSMFVALPGNKTLLASPGKDYVVDALKQARLKKKPALKNKEFQAVLEKLDSKQGLSLAVLGKAIGKSELLDSLPQGMRDALGNIEVIGGGASFGNEIKLDLVVSTKTARNALRLRNVLTRGIRLAQVGLAFLAEERKELALLNEVLNTVRIGGKGKLVALSARLTADVLEDFRKDKDSD
jgi:hypothetical protein